MSSSSCFIADDCWKSIIYFLELVDITNLSVVSRYFKNLTNDHQIWETFCKILWKNKQFHPLERWIKIETRNVVFPIKQDNMLSRPPRGSKSRCEVRLDEYSNSVDSIDKALEDILTLKVNLMHEIAKSKKSLLEHDLTIENFTHLKYLESLYEHFSLIKHHECALNNKKEIFVNRNHPEKNASESKSLEPFNKNEISWINSQNFQEISRQACPLSRYVKLKRIREVEYKYYELLSEVKKLKEELKLDSSSNFFSYEEEHEKVSKETYSFFETKHKSLNQLISKVEILERTMINNFSDPIDIKEEERKALVEGRLLSWKESFIASIKDSRRTSITYEELREIGEMAILFGNVLETIRFVHGGCAIVDDRCFSRFPGLIYFHGSTFYIPYVGCSGTVVRSDIDWGWEFVCFGRFIRIASFDRKKGFKNHQGALSRNSNRNKWFPKPLLSISSKNKLYGLYN